MQLYHTCNEVIFLEVPSLNGSVLVQEETTYSFITPHNELILLDHHGEHHGEHHGVNCDAGGNRRSRKKLWYRCSTKGQIDNTTQFQTQLEKASPVTNPTRSGAICQQMFLHHLFLQQDFISKVNMDGVFKIPFIESPALQLKRIFNYNPAVFTCGFF